jgi:hypothetical protein
MCLRCETTKPVSELAARDEKETGNENKSLVEFFRRMLARCLVPSIISASSFGSLEDLLKDLEAKLRCEQVAQDNQNRCAEQAKQLFGAAKSIALLGCELGYLFQTAACE